MQHKKHWQIMILSIVFFCSISSCSKSIQWTIKDVPYGTDKQQVFNIILPKKKNDAHAIVYIHGGFYSRGNKLWHPLFLADYSESNIFATMDYRLMQSKDNTVHIQDMISDVNEALLKIQEVSKENGIFIKDFILTGHSAGAHLALLYGYKYFDENSNKGINIAACVSLSGPTDYTDDFGWSSTTYYGTDLQKRLSRLSQVGTELTGNEIILSQYNWTEQDNYYEYKKFIEEISPIMYVHNTKKLPATLLVHGLDDRVVPYSNAIKLNRMLDNTSVPHKLITVTGIGNNHMLGGKPNTTNSIEPIKYTNQPWYRSKVWYKNQPWVNEVEKWLELYLE